MSTTGVSDYRLAAPVAVRILGLLLAVAGFLVALTAVLVAAFSWPRTVLSVVLVVAVLALVVLGFLVTRRAAVVRLDATGYTVRLVRGAGVKQGRWKDVEDVVATTVEGERCVVLRPSRPGPTTSCATSSSTSTGVTATARSPEGRLAPAAGRPVACASLSGGVA